jgi:transposase-like protein
MKCPKCEQDERQYRNGKTKAGSQRYSCHHCGSSYTPAKKAQEYSPTLRQKAIQIYIDGAGLRRTGRQLGVHQTVANWAKDQAEQLPETAVPAVVKTAEFDEIFTYIGDKKADLSHYAGRSRHALLFGLEGGVGALARTRASHCRSCHQSRLVLQ